LDCEKGGKRRRKSMINKELLKSTLSLITKDEEFGYKFSSKLYAIPIKIKFGHAKSVENIPPIGRFLQFIEHNYFDLITITNRLAWQKQMAIKKELSMGDWMSFAQLDVELFFMKIRSIFDYVFFTLCRISDCKKIPSKKRKSFNTLRNWLTDQNEGKKNAKNWDADLAKLVLSADWFDLIKSVRDSIFHEGAYTFVFHDTDRILFQVHSGSGYKNKISIPEVMYNENVVDFELFAGVYFGYLVAFLEDFAINVEKKLPVEVRKIETSPFTLYKKLPPIFEWVTKLL
jgi:hypothetical protein